MLKLVKPTIEFEHEYIDYISEWEKSGEKIVPFASRRDGFDFLELLSKWEFGTTDKVYSDTVFFG